MASGYDRAQMEEDLRTRTEQSYNTRGGKKFIGYFEPGLAFPAWNAGEGEHEVVVVPYRAGPNDPVNPKGKWTHFLDVYVHRNVGPRDLQFVCLEQFNQECPICTERNKLRKNPPEGERQLKAYEERLKQLNTSRRCVYNIIVADGGKEEAKGIQVWEIAHYNMEEKVAPLAKVDKRRGGGFILWSDPKTGKALKFERKGTGFKNTKYLGHQLVDRTFDVTDQDLSDCLCLDELIHMPTAEEISDAFWGEAPPDEEAQQEAAPRPRVRVRQDASEQPEEGDPPPRARRRAEPEPDPEDEVPDEPAPRPRARMTVDEPAPAPRRATTNRCPVGGKFGEDTNALEACETCPEATYGACVSLQRKMRAEKRVDIPEDEPVPEAPAPRARRVEAEAPAPRARRTAPAEDEPARPRARRVAEEQEPEAPAEEQSPAPRARRGAVQDADPAPAPRARPRAVAPPEEPEDAPAPVRRPLRR